MNTVVSPVHAEHPAPPDEQELLRVPVPRDRSALPIADRLSLRIGLWLLLRAQRRRTEIEARLPNASVSPPGALAHSPAGGERALTLSTYGLLRQLR